MSISASLSSKGQIVIPSQVREQMGVSAGSRLEFIASENGWLIKPLSGNVTALRGVLRKPRVAVSVDAMNEAIRTRAKALHKASLGKK